MFWSVRKVGITKINHHKSWIPLVPVEEGCPLSWVRGAFNIGIKHGFSCINIRQASWEVLKTEAEGRGFQHLPRDLAIRPRFSTPPKGPGEY